MTAKVNPHPSSAVKPVDHRDLEQLISGTHFNPHGYTDGNAHPDRYRHAPG